MVLSERSRAVKFLVRDRDTKFSASFDEVFRAEGIRIIKTSLELALPGYDAIDIR
jgi:hypothetical protein